jgi:GNAT acetyltransferase-like protein
MSDRAALLDDRGEAAASEEFFRSPRFLAAESVTHTLKIGEAPALPVVVREIPGTELRDATSPYGYPGGSTAPSMDARSVDWSGLGLVSVFVRDRVGTDACFAGGTVRTNVQIADPALPRKSRMSDRQQIRRNARDGWTVETVPGGDVDGDQRAGFEKAYRETMERAAAPPRYFFSSEYFESLLAGDRAWLLLARSPDGSVGAGSLAVRSDGLLHYYLSGTAEEFLTASPMKNIIEKLIELSAEKGLPLNLGGGARPGDSLEAFKRGFANREEPFHTHEIVCDPGAYEELIAGRDDTGFFPLYRSG